MEKRRRRGKCETHQKILFIQGQLNNMSFFFVPAIRPAQPLATDVPSVQAEPLEDPEPRAQLHRDHGGPQRAEAPHLAESCVQQHQGDRAAAPKREAGTPRPLGQRHPGRHRHLASKESQGEDDEEANCALSFLSHRAMGVDR